MENLLINDKTVLVPIAEQTNQIEIVPQYEVYESTQPLTENDLFSADLENLIEAVETSLYGPPQEKSIKTTSLPTTTTATTTKSPETTIRTTTIKPLTENTTLTTTSNKFVVKIKSFEDSQNISVSNLTTISPIWHQNATKSKLTLINTTRMERVLTTTIKEKSRNSNNIISNLHGNNSPFDDFYDRSLAIFNRQKKSHSIKKRVHDFEEVQNAKSLRPTKGR